LKPMKSFKRFPHEGVIKDLERVQTRFVVPGLIDSGSSSDGELTLRSAAVTAYVRKYRREIGWRVVIWRSGGLEEKHYPVSAEEVIQLLAVHFS